MNIPIIEDTHFVLYEKPDSYAAARIMNHPMVWKHQRQQYESYHNRLESAPNGCIPVKYYRREYARAYVTDTSVMSATPMWGPARSALMNKTDLDIDGVQQHPNELLDVMDQLYVKDPEDCPKYDALKAMCERREEIFAECTVSEEWLARYNGASQNMSTVKDVLKSICNLIIFGGTEETFRRKWVPEKPASADKGDWHAQWAPKEGVDYALCDQMKKYIKQIPKLAKYVVNCDEFDKIVSWHKANKEKAGEDKPHPGSCLAIILQDIEAQMIISVMQHFSSVGLHPTVYAYDGFQIRRPETEDQQQQLEQALAAVNTYHPYCRFIVKPWREALDLSSVPAREFEFDPINFENLRASAKTEEEKGWVYARQKEYFETTHAIVLATGSVAEIERSGHYKGVRQLDTAAAATVTFKNLHTYTWKPPSGKDEGKYEKKDFFKRWLSDPYRRQYRSIEMFPPGGRPCPKGCLNLWTGWPIEQVPLDPAANCDLVLQHFEELIPDEKMRKYVLDWHAHKVQRPGRKIMTCLVLYGLSGAGKSIVSEKTWQAFCPDHYYQTSRVEDLTGQFADNSQYIAIVLNEANSKDNMNAADALKNCITEETTRREIKCKQAEKNINCCHDSIATTNTQCVQVGEQGRQTVRHSGMRVHVLQHET